MSLYFTNAFCRKSKAIFQMLFKYCLLACKLPLLHLTNQGIPLRKEITVDSMFGKEDLSFTITSQLADLYFFIAMWMSFLEVVVFLSIFLGGFRLRSQWDVTAFKSRVLLSVQFKERQIIDRLFLFFLVHRVRFEYNLDTGRWLFTNNPHAFNHLSFLVDLIIIQYSK